MTASPGVLDASVAVKSGSHEARRAVAQHADWVAPDLILLEVANVALKSVKMGLIEHSQGSAMVDAAPRLLRAVVSSEALCIDAFALGATHGFSAYDAAYVALAIQCERPLLTADRRLAERARVGGLSDHIRLLAAP